MTTAKTAPDLQEGDAALAAIATKYVDLLTEVEAIVRDVASPDLDLDQLVAKVERGYTLIKTMRTRLDQTKGRVEQLRDEFSQSTSGG